MNINLSNARRIHSLYIADNKVFLEHLQKTHKQQIDFIYIDPPYNIHRNLIYTNNYPREKWIHMMREVLMLAVPLLSKQGIIMLSIDDYEQAYLKVLCDEIFNEKCFLGTIIWHNGVAANQKINIQKNHEYIHVYAASPNQQLFRRMCEISHDKIHYDKKGAYIITSGLTASPICLNGRPNMGSSIYWREVDNHMIFLDDYDKQKARVSNSYDEIYKKPNEILLKAGYVCIRPKMNGTRIRGWSKTRASNE